MLGCKRRQQAMLARLLGRPLPSTAQAVTQDGRTQECWRFRCSARCRTVWLPCSAIATPYLSCRTSHLPLPTSLASHHFHVGTDTVLYLGRARAHGPMSHGRRRWAPRSLLALTLPQLKKNSDGRLQQGLSLGWAGQRCPAEWLLGELTTTLDSLERFGWLSPAGQRHVSPLFSPWRDGRGAGGPQGPSAATTGQRAHPCRRACECLQRCPGSLVPHRSCVCGRECSDCCRNTDQSGYSHKISVL